MKILPLCPFPVLPLPWEASPGLSMLTVVVKATYLLAPGREPEPAPTQEPLGGDRLWDVAPGAGLFCPSDWAPQKARAEVLLVGHAYAPQGHPVDTLIARLQIAGVSKAVRVGGDRLWVRGPAGPVPSRPALFARMALSDDRAPRSPASPFGVVAGAPREGKLAVPNLDPSSFAPVAPAAPARRALVDDAGFAWAYRLHGPAPAGFSFAFFNAAPWDQRTDELRPGAPVRLENLHPAHPVLETWLPEARPRAFVATPGSAGMREMALVCDTVWIDSDRGLMVLSYRGVVEMARAEIDLGALAVAVASRAAPDVEREVAAALGVAPAQAAGAGGADEDPATLRPPPPDDGTGTVEFSVEAVAAARKAAGLPFQRHGAPGIVEAPAPRETAGESHAGQTIDFGVRPSAAPVTPFAGEPAQASAGAGADHTIGFSAMAPGRAATPFRADAQPGYVPGPSAPSQQSGLTVDFVAPGALPTDLAALAAALRAQRAAPPPPPPEEPPLPPAPPPMAPPLMAPPLMAPPLMAVPPPPPAPPPPAPPPPAPPPPAPPPAPPTEPLALERYAEINVDLARKRAPAQALAARGVDAATWERTDTHWKPRLGDRAHRDAYDAAFVSALEKARDEGAFTVADYARIMVGVERGQLPALAAAYGVPPPDVMRVQRVWLKRVASDAALGAAAVAAVAAARER